MWNVKQEYDAGHSVKCDAIVFLYGSHIVERKRRPL